jgi:hypothetical protein
VFRSAVALVSWYVVVQVCCVCCCAGLLVCLGPQSLVCPSSGMLGARIRRYVRDTVFNGGWSAVSAGLLE